MDDDRRTADSGNHPRRYKCQVNEIIEPFHPPGRIVFVVFIVGYVDGEIIPLQQVQAFQIGDLVRSVIDSTSRRNDSFERSMHRPACDTAGHLTLLRVLHRGDNAIHAHAPELRMRPHYQAVMID